MVAALKRPHPLAPALGDFGCSHRLAHELSNEKGLLVRALEEKNFTITTESDQDTIRVGQEIGRLLSEGDVVGLVGELGSGKTWLTKGIALGLGVSPKTIVTSPSFTLVNEYRGRAALYHMDVYRLGSLDEALSAGIEETIHTGGVVVLEWADRWPEILPEHTLTVRLIIVDEHRRAITLSGRHPRANEIIGQLKHSGSPSCPASR